MKEVVQAAKEYMLAEKEKYVGPPTFVFLKAMETAERLAKELNADEDIASIGAWLMDIKLPQAKKEKRIKEHVEMSIKATEEFLDKHNVTVEQREKIVNCVAGHHGTIPWTCKEAEICANADCYKFLVTRVWLRWVCKKGAQTEEEFDKFLEYAEYKTDEKWNVLSLDICKEELEPEYRAIKEICKYARRSS